MSTKLLSEDEIHARLESAIASAGGVRALARKLGIAHPFISKVRARQIPPSGVVAEALGIERVVTTGFRVRP